MITTTDALAARALHSWDMALYFASRDMYVIGKQCWSARNSTVRSGERLMAINVTFRALIGGINISCYPSRLNRAARSPSPFVHSKLRRARGCINARVHAVGESTPRNLRDYFSSRKLILVGTARLLRSYLYMLISIILLFL